MNRGDIDTPAGSSCGGLHIRARDICDIDVRCERRNGTVYSVGAEALARRPVRVIGKRKDEMKIRSRDSKELEERQQAAKQTSLDEPRHERAEEDMRAPVWWQLEVEGHSYNRRNKNRVRRYLQRVLDHLEANEVIPERVKLKELQRRRVQLEALQRPRRCTKKRENDGRRGGRKKRRGGEKKLTPSGRQPNWWEGRNVPDCRKGLPVHSVTVMCYRMVHRVARGRRYGVISDGNKFHGLYHQACMKEKAEQEAQEGRRQRQEEEVKQMPWNYEEQNRANAELLLGLSANNTSYGVGMSAEEWEVCNYNLASDSAEGVPFDLDGCSQMWSIFDARRYSGEVITNGYEREEGRLQLDSGYYVEVETGRASQDEAVSSKGSQDDAEFQAHSGTMRVVVHHKGETQEWEVSPQDTVQQLQLFVQNKWGIGPDRQRFQIDGLPTCPTLRLGLLGDGVELQVMSAMQGGGFKKPKEGRKRGGKGGAARAGRYRARKKQALLYNDVKSIMEARSRPNDEVSFQEYEDEMEAREFALSKVKVAGLIAEKEYENKLKKMKVPIYGNLRMHGKASDSIRVMSVNINGISMTKRGNCKVDRLRQLMS